MLAMPAVAVVHTLSDNLYDPHHYNLFHLANAVDRMVVMSPASRNAMGSYHAVAKGRVAVIPHGVPRIQQVGGGCAAAAPHRCCPLQLPHTPPPQPHNPNSTLKKAPQCRCPACAPQAAGRAPAR
jgi:hypothetical protein